MDDSGEIFPSALFASSHCACLGGRQMATFWKRCHQSDPCVVLPQEAVIWILALFWPYSGYRHITGLLLLFSVTVCDFMHSEAPQKRLWGACNFLPWADRRVGLSVAMVTRLSDHQLQFDWGKVHDPKQLLQHDLLAKICSTLFHHQKPDFDNILRRRIGGEKMSPSWCLSGFSLQGMKIIMMMMMMIMIDSTTWSCFWWRIRKRLEGHFNLSLVQGSTLSQCQGLSNWNHTDMHQTPVTRHPFDSPANLWFAFTPRTVLFALLVATILGEYNYQDRQRMAKIYLSLTQATIRGVANFKSTGQHAALLWCRFPTDL